MIPSWTTEKKDVPSPSVIYNRMLEILKGVPGEVRDGMPVLISQRIPGRITEKIARGISKRIFEKMPKKGTSEEFS